MSQLKNGVLLINLGTPSAATAKAVRAFLRPFLSDRRVVDLTAWLWQPLLNLIILPRRAPIVAKRYQALWQEQGSPLGVISQQQRQKLAQSLPSLAVEVAMTYGTPSLMEAWQKLKAQGVERLIVLPLYPQYSATTTAAAFDALARSLAAESALPELRFIRDYAEHPAYIAALANSVRRHWAQFGRCERLLISFHGIPQRYADRGDPYPRRCQKTAELLAQELGLQSHEWSLSYQSRFGREPWLLPATEEQIQSLARSGVKSLCVIAPGFAADCLETLDELAIEGREQFLQAGGERYSYIPALNDSIEAIQLFKQLILEEVN